MEKVYFIAKMSGPAMVRPASSDFWKAPLELLKWWSELREDNALNNDWHYVIWNNGDFRIDDKPFFYKKYYDISIWKIGDLHFDLSNTES